MNIYLSEAEAMKSQLISSRRYLHENAEVGFELPKTTSFVTEKLKAMGYEPKDVAGGVVCDCGSGDKTILLRADMDALPQKELTGLEFACRSGIACHSCGHDFHTSMLLGAAEILKKHESELTGTVKFVFQPGEETLEGSRRMIESGVLRDPDVDAAMGLHMMTGPMDNDYPDVGTLLYTDCMASADEFKITVHGVSSHGSAPQNGISAINIGSLIVAEVQQSLALSFTYYDDVVISFGTFSSGSAPNIIPEEAVLTGTIRTFNRDVRNRAKKMLEKLCKKSAAVWGADCDVDFTKEVSVNANSPELTDEMLNYCSDVVENVVKLPLDISSDDFANFGEYVPTFFANIGGGSIKDGHNHTIHDPHVNMDEDALPYGTAVYVSCAVGWLNKHSSAK